MKKLCLAAIIAIFSLSTVKAQEGLNAGIHIGFPVGDASDIVGFGFGIDVSYLFEVSDEFHAGFASGFTTASGKNNRNGRSFIPIAATGRYAFSDQFFGALDLGYAISTVTGVKGAFYVQPKGGWTSDKADVFLFYKSIDGFGTLGVGAAYRFDL